MMNLIAFMFQGTSDNAGNSAAAAGVGITAMLIGLAIAVIMVASMWKIFVKAGKPGWAAIIPIYNLIVLLEIAGKPLWWFILFLIPIVNLIVAIMVVASVARKFGKGIGFAIGMLVLAPIFYPMLAFGDSTYIPAA